MECVSVELWEDPEMNWRDAYHERICLVREDLRRARANGSTQPEYFDWKRWVPRDLTDAQIDYLARRKAERTIEYAINERKALTVKSRKRAGVAY